MSLKDYTRKDISDIRAYLISLIDDLCNKYGTKSWTDRNESDLGMVFVELAAGVADMMNFYIDKQALENYLPTVVQRKNMKRILNLVNYKMRGPEPSRSVALFSLSNHFDFDFTIPKYFQLSYAREGTGNIYYATAEAVDVPAGVTEVQVPIVQGIVRTVNMSVADLMRFRTTTITNDNVANGSIVLTIDGTEWEQVPDVLVDDDFGTKYSVYEDINDQAVIEFGYSWKNYLPANLKAPVVLQYLTTEGAHGAVSAGNVNTIEDDLIANGRNIKERLTVTNLYDATGGADREDMEEARIKAPHIVKTKLKIATLEDYRSFAENIQGVYKAQAVDWNTGNGKFVTVPYKVNVYVVPEDELTLIPNMEQREYIYNQFFPYLWCSIELSILPPEIRNIDIIVRVTMNTDISNAPGLRSELEGKYRDFFSKNNRSFGETFTVGQIENIARESSFVDSVEVLAPTAPIELSEIEFPNLNNLDIEIVGDTE